MNIENSYGQLTKEGAENAAKLILSQLRERLNLNNDHSAIDKELECMQFGICSNQPK